VTVTVQYFAILREQRGLSSETVDTQAETAGALYEELRARHGFTLSGGLVRTSVNLNLCPPGTRLSEGDDVVFIPPVAGG